MISRRFMLGAAAVTAGVLAARPALAARTADAEASARLQALETGHARLGVCLLDTATGAATGSRLDEHFAMCSTFKLAMVGAVLREADAGRLRLDEVLPYTERDLLAWAPVTGPKVAQRSLPVIELAQAAQQFSDGTAANLLVRRLGGPAAVTRAFREMGDRVSRLDRYEPDLGMVLSGDLRDTTTPRAMAETVRRLVLGDLLSPGSRQRLLDWMIATGTGPKRLRAGLPAGWRVGNKTGTGRDPGITNKCNDIAVVFPPGRGPIVIAAYYDSGEYTDRIEDRHQAVLAEVGRIAAGWAKA